MVSSLQGSATAGRSPGLCRLLISQLTASATATLPSAERRKPVRPGARCVAARLPEARSFAGTPVPSGGWRCSPSPGDGTAPEGFAQQAIDAADRDGTHALARSQPGARADRIGQQARSTPWSHPPVSASCWS